MASATTDNTIVMPTLRASMPRRRGQGGATVIVATHALEFTEVAERCVGLRDGELAYDGPASADQVERLVS